MVAKRFFYVCAGLLCLALAYHFGATSATAAKPGSTIIAAECDWPVAVACVDRTVYVLDVTNPQGLRNYPSIPGTDPVIAVNYSGSSNHITAMLLNGNAYTTLLNGDGTWEFMGNAIGAR